MTPVDPGRAALVIVGMGVLAWVGAAVLAGLLRLALPLGERFVEGRLSRQGSARAQKLASLARDFVEAAVIGVAAAGGSGVLTVLAGLSLGGQFSVTALSELRGPWMVAAVLGTWTANAAAVATAVRLGTRLALGWPGWRLMLLAPLLEVGVVAGVAGWGFLIQAAGVDAEAQGLAEALASAVGWQRGLLVIYVLVGAPAVEECLFRGWLQPLFARRFSAGIAIFLQALCFGMLHLDRLWAIPPIVLIGAACGWLRHRSGSLFPGFVLHAINNGLALLA